MSIKTNRKVTSTTIPMLSLMLLFLSNHVVITTMLLTSSSEIVRTDEIVEEWSSPSSSLPPWPFLYDNDNLSFNKKRNYSTIIPIELALALSSSSTSIPKIPERSSTLKHEHKNHKLKNRKNKNRNSLPSVDLSKNGDHRKQSTTNPISSVHYGYVAAAQNPQYQPQPQYPHQYPSFSYNHPNQMWPAVDDNWNSWNRVFKLILLSFVSTIGSMGAIFIVSAITVIDTFQVRGNCFLVSLAFGHLLVTLLVLPASAIAIMADIQEDQTICHFQWLITMACFVVSVLSFLFMSIDNYFGMKSLITYQLCCTRCRICFLLLIIWTAAFIIPFMQHNNHYGPEFCKDKRHWKILINYHPYALGILILCTIITLAYFTYSIFMYKNYKSQLESSPEAANFILTDGCLLQSNVIVYLISLAMWLPLIAAMVADSVNPVPQDYMDTVWYIALSNSCSFSYMYAATNRDFREAFNKLFYYCCCKSHVTFSRKGAVIRRTVANESMGLRVHIIPGLNIYAQRKDTTQTSSYRTGGYGGGIGGHSGGGFGGHSGGHYGGGYSGGFGGKSHKSCEL